MDLGELYETRMLVFIETGPQSNKYRQVGLTKEQFNTVSESISYPSKKQSKSLKPNVQMREIDLSDEVYTLPDLNSIMKKEEYENKSK